MVLAEARAKVGGPQKGMGGGGGRGGAGEGRGRRSGWERRTGRRAREGGEGARREERERETETDREKEKEREREIRATNEQVPPLKIYSTKKSHKKVELTKLNLFVPVEPAKLFSSPW